MPCDFDSYLFRLGLRRSKPTVIHLRELQRAHQATIPLENFDLFLGVKRPWDIAALCQKVNGGRRGGLGIELNAIFGQLLTQIGFRSMYAGLASPDEPGKISHMALVIIAEGQNWLVDVGRDEAPFDPVPIVEGQVSVNFTQYVRMVSGEDQTMHYQVSTDGVHFTTQFVLHMRNCRLIEFLHLHDELQSLYQSAVASEKSISKVQETGRLTLTPSQLVRTQGTQVLYREAIQSEQHFDQRLKEEFDIEWTDLLQ